MNDSSAHKGRSRKTSGRRLQERSRPSGGLSARDLVDRLELRERLAAIIDEIDRGEAEDVARTIAEGCLEELNLLLTEETSA